MYKIATLCNVNVGLLDQNTVVGKMEYFPFPENGTWRIPLIKELLSIESQQCILPYFLYKGNQCYVD